MIGLGEWLKEKGELSGCYCRDIQVAGQSTVLRVTIRKSQVEQYVGNVCWAGLLEGVIPELMLEVICRSFSDAAESLERGLLEKFPEFRSVFYPRTALDRILEGDLGV